MASTYEDVPVFRSGTMFGDGGPENIIGKAQVSTDEATGKVTITIETLGDKLPSFLDLGELKAFELNTYVNNVGREKQKEWLEQQ